MLPHNFEAGLHRLASMESGYFKQPLPCDADKEVATFILGFAAADEPVRSALRQALTPVHVDALVAFWVRMATLTVRERSIARLRLGLFAVALAAESPGADRWDTSRSFSPLVDAAFRLREDCHEAFFEAARLARQPMAGALRFAAPPRWPWLRAAKRMLSPLPKSLWRAVETPDGFRYLATNTRTENELLQWMTRERMKMLDTALDAYQRDTGRYPTTAEGLNALWQVPSEAARSAMWKGPYLPMGVPVDFWGRPYVYTCPGDHNRSRYDLLSYGADGQPGGEGDAADVVNWE